MTLLENNKTPESTMGEEDSATTKSNKTSGAPGALCGIMGRNPILTVLVFAAAGVAIGIGLSTWVPEDGSTSKETAVQWIGLIGDMFIRALKATVLPLVFVNVIVSIVDMMSVGKAGTIGFRTVLLYTVTTLIASIIGLISILSFKSLFKTEIPESSFSARVQLGCDSEGSFLTYDINDGNVFCSVDGSNETSNYFNIVDVDLTFASSSSGPANDISVSQQIYDGVFGKLITSNIFESFVESNFAAVVFFAIAMGAALARTIKHRNVSPDAMVFVIFLKEIDEVFVTLIHWIIAVTPFAVLSLIASAIGQQDNLQDSFANVGYLCLAVMTGMIVHVCFVYTGLYAFMTGRNPLHYMKYILPAQTTAFACASSAATMPITLECAANSGVVPSTIARFVIPLGATLNMDGTAIYYPCACIWLAVLNGITPNAANYILLIVLATVGSAGTAPVPNSGLVMVLTAYNTVFGTTGTPDGFAFVVAIDWFLDRLCTVVNVTGDLMVTGMVAQSINLEDEEESVEEMKKTVHMIDDIPSEELDV